MYLRDPARNEVREPELREGQGEEWEVVRQNKRWKLQKVPVVYEGNCEMMKFCSVRGQDHLSLNKSNVHPSYICLIAHQIFIDISLFNSQDNQYRIGTLLTISSVREEKRRGQQEAERGLDPKSPDLESSICFTSWRLLKNHTREVLPTQKSSQRKGRQEGGEYERAQKPVPLLHR